MLIVFFKMYQGDSLKREICSALLKINTLFHIARFKFIS